MKRWVLALLVMLASSPVFAKPNMKGTNYLGSAFKWSWEFDTSTDASDVHGASGMCTATFIRGGSETVTLYQTTASTATGGTAIATFSATSTVQTELTYGQPNLYAVSDGASSGGSLTILCTPLQVSSAGKSNPFDACRSGGTKGGGYNSGTGRYAWTCGNYNWGAEQNLADASYFVDCTGDGTPHTSCLRSGERRLINAMYRSALAPYYTEDGGTVFFPKFPGKDHGIYVFTGCGTSEDATENPCPQPYDPAVEALGYRSYNYVVSRMRCGQRGVSCVAEGNPEVEDGKSATPTLSGVWFVNDGGNDGGGGPASAARDGVNDQYAAEWVFGVGYTGTTVPQYCVDSGDGTFTCDTTPSFDNAGSWGYNFTSEHFSDYGVAGKLTNDIDFNNFGLDEPAGCFQNGIGVCTADAGEPCNSDSDCSSGTCTINEATTSATCELDRRVRCWNLTTDANRTAGGCVSDDGLTDLGTCQPFGTAIQADIEAGKDYLLLAKYAACDGTPDDAKDVTLCESSEYVTPMTIRSFDQTLTTACTGNYAEASIEIPFGPTSLHPNNTDGEDESTGFVQRYIIAGSDGDGRPDLWFPIEWSKFDLKGAGFDSFGFMPANWYGRDSATAAADCLSANDYDSTDDEAVCDTGALLNHMAGYNGVINNFVALNASGVNKSNLDGIVGSIYPTFQNGSVLYGRRNTFTDPNWGWQYDNIAFVENYSAATGVNFFGPLVKIRNSRFIGNKANPLVFSGNAAGIFGTVIESTDFISNSSAGNGFINLVGGKSYRFENLRFLGTYTDYPFIIMPGGTAYGDRESVQSVLIRNVFSTGLANNARGMVYIACSTDSGASNEYVSNLIVDNVHFKTLSSAWVPLVSVSDTDTSNCQVIERAGSWLIQNSTIEGRAQECIFAHNGNCSTATGNAWGPNDALDSTQIAASSSLPRMFGNSASNLPVADWPISAVKAANVPDCSTLPDGYRVTIIDDATAVGTCADAGADGLLDGGGTYFSTCICDPAGDSGDGAWSAP